MSYIDTFKIEKMTFQLNILEIAKKKLTEIDMCEGSCNNFYKSIIKNYDEICEGLKDRFIIYDKNAIEKDCIAEMIPDNIFNMNIQRVDDEELFGLGENFQYEYGGICEYIEFSVEDGKFIIMSEDDEDYEKVEHDPDFELEFPGYMLWNELEEYGCMLQYDFESDESNFLKYWLYGGSLYEITIGSGCMYNAIKKAYGDKQKTRFITRFLDAYVYMVCGYHLIAITPFDSDEIKLLVLKNDPWWSAEHFMKRALKEVPKLLLMKKYIMTTMQEA